MGIHLGCQTHVAEEGSYSTAEAQLPVLHYFPVKGRAEPIRLTLAYKQQAWFEPEIEPIYKIVKSELDGYPFRQLPRFIDDAKGGRIDLVQSTAILRHLGRKYGLYGANEAEAAYVDMVIEAAAELRVKFRGLVNDQKSSEEGQQQYLSTVLAPEDQLGGLEMQGPGLASLERVLRLQRYSSSGWAVGDAPTIADFPLFDLTDLHLNLFEEHFKTTFPHLYAHRNKVAELPGIKEYLVSDNRHSGSFLPEWLAQRAQQD